MCIRRFQLLTTGCNLHAITYSVPFGMNPQIIYILTLYAQTCFEEAQIFDTKMV